jgi:hypothetical protein
MVEIDLIMESGKETLDQIKSRLIASIRANKEYWEDKEEEIQTIVSQVMASTTLADIITYLAKLRGLTYK